MQNPELFASPGKVPLAERLRPTRLADIVGQEHLLGMGAPLQLAVASGVPHSMILWGPPGVGKTTLARLLAHAFGLRFVSLSAVLGGVKEIREAVAFAQAQQPHGTLVFVDEVHRFNKAQQDAFLPHVESGLLVFVGATTENPSFEVNSALLSRATVYLLRRLEHSALRALVERALGQESATIEVAEDALSVLLESADGDGRRLLNLLEVLLNTQRLKANSARGGDHPVPLKIGLATLKACLGERVRQFDQGGDVFYDQISALHKSVRGSNPEAGLYWLARLIDGGADPRYLARRIVRMSCEDIGLADPRALQVATEAAQAWERLGSPEGDLALAMAVTYLCAAPKSDAVYRAWQQARSFVADRGSDAVPPHLRNAPTALLKSLNYGSAYRNPHEEPHAYAAGVSYLPDDIAGVQWYFPSERGLEAKIAEKLQRLRALDHNASSGDLDP